MSLTIIIKTNITNRFSIVDLPYDLADNKYLLNKDLLLFLQQGHLESHALKAIIKYIYREGEFRNCVKITLVDSGSLWVILIFSKTEAIILIIFVFKHNTNIFLQYHAYHAKFHQKEQK